MTLRSSLSRFQPDARMSTDEIEQAKRHAWQRHGLIVVDPAELESEWLSRGMTAWADGRYGARTGPQSARGGRHSGANGKSSAE